MKQKILFFFCLLLTLIITADAYSLSCAPLSTYYIAKCENNECVLVLVVNEKRAFSACGRRPIIREAFSECEISDLKKIFSNNFKNESGIYELEIEMMGGDFESYNLCNPESFSLWKWAYGHNMARIKQISDNIEQFQIEKHKNIWRDREKAGLYTEVFLNIINWGSLIIGLILIVISMFRKWLFLQTIIFIIGVLLYVYSIAFYSDGWLISFLVPLITVIWVSKIASFLYKNIKKNIKKHNKSVELTRLH